jgi:hypothetical protein
MYECPKVRGEYTRVNLAEDKEDKDLTTKFDEAQKQYFEKLHKVLYKTNLSAIEPHLSSDKLWVKLRLRCRTCLNKLGTFKTKPSEEPDLPLIIASLSSLSPPKCDKNYYEILSAHICAPPKKKKKKSKDSFDATDLTSEEVGSNSSNNYDYDDNGRSYDDDHVQIGVAASAAVMSEDSSNVSSMHVETDIGTY